MEQYFNFAMCLLLKHMIYCLCFYYFFLKIFFVPRTWSGCYDQIPEFFYCESLVLSGFILIYQGLLYGRTFIHSSIILRRRLTRFKLPKGFLGLKIVVSRNSSDILEWGPGMWANKNWCYTFPTPLHYSTPPHNFICL